MNNEKIGRYSDLNNIPEVGQLEYGMDFRRPEYRREVFLRFYEFHTKYRAHPGCVYYAMPFLFGRYNLSKEQRLWLCFINGICQNIVTSWEIFERFPDFDKVKKDTGDLFTFFRENYTKFGWDTDRKWVKNKFEGCIDSYINLIGDNSQEEYFNRFTSSEDKFLNFDTLWEEVINNFYLFGRLSTFSYLEYLFVAGLNIDCSSLFLDDISGSKSHRNGLCKVLGRDDLDHHDSNPDFNGVYTPKLLDWLKEEADELLTEASKRFKGTSYFTLESTLCSFKSFFRKNRRYPNVYNDMFYLRILVNEKAFGRINNVFRGMRTELLPKYLVVEKNAKDPGLCTEKQNYFLNTGKVLMMDLEWDCFKNDFFNKKYIQDGLFDNRPMRLW